MLKLWSQYREFELSTLLFGKGAVHHFGIDSFYLKLLLSGGILGLVAHFILIYFILRVSIYVMRNSQCRLDELTGMMAIVITISIEWLNATGLYFYSGRISESFWVILGSVFVLYRIMQKEKTGVHIESITMYENRD